MKRLERLKQERQKRIAARSDASNPQKTTAKASAVSKSTSSLAEMKIFQICFVVWILNREIRLETKTSSFSQTRLYFVSWLFWKTFAQKSRGCMQFTSSIFLFCGEFTSFINIKHWICISHPHPGSKNHACMGFLGKHAWIARGRGQWPPYCVALDKQCCTMDKFWIGSEFDACINGCQSDHILLYIDRAKLIMWNTVRATLYTVYYTRLLLGPQNAGPPKHRPPK